MNKRVYGLLAAVLLALTPALHAEEDLEVFRGELLEYVHGLERLPAGMLRSMYGQPSLPAAEEQIRTLTPDELRVLRDQMNKVPYWRELPRILANAVPDTAPQLGLAAESTMDVVNTSVERLVREQLLTFVGILGSMPRELVAPDYPVRIARLEQMVRTADREQLLAMQRAVRENAPRWNEQMNAPRKGRIVATGVATDGHCGGDFLSVFICEMQHVVDTIVNLGSQITSFASNAVNAVVGGLQTFFQSLQNVLPGAGNFAQSAPGLVLQHAGLQAPNWNSVANTIGSNLRIPCPADGTQIPFFGPTGTIRTAVHFNGSIGFLGNMIAEVTPGDLLTGLNLQAVAQVINAPIQWLGGCLDDAYAANNEEDEGNHQTLVTSRLNTNVASRATQTSVDGVQGQTTSLDASVAVVEQKIDALPDEAIENTTLRTIAVADVLRATSIRFDQTTSRVESKVQNLQAQQAQTWTLLRTLRTKHLRMLVEMDLSRDANTRLAMFQLPSSAGGWLELVKDVVEETLQNRSAAGVNVASARKELTSGVQQHTAGNFKAAYDHFRKAYGMAVN